MMLTNVPNFLTQGALISLLEDLTAGMRGAFDFFYCPWDPYEDKNLGYAIINFFSRSVAAEFERTWASKPLLQGTRGMKKLRIVPAALQGRAANLRHFSGFGLAHHVDPRFRPLVRAGPNEALRPMAISQELARNMEPTTKASVSRPAVGAQHGLPMEPLPEPQTSAIAARVPRNPPSSASNSSTDWRSVSGLPQHVKTYRENVMELLQRISDPGVECPPTDHLMQRFHDRFIENDDARCTQQMHVVEPAQEVFATLQNFKQLQQWTMLNQLAEAGESSFAPYPHGDALLSSLPETCFQIVQSTESLVRD